MPMSLGLEAGSIGGEVLNKIFDVTGNLVTMRKAANSSINGSLVKMTKVARVEPLCVVDSDCINLEYISDVLNTLQSIFSGYYLQAVSLIGTVSGVQVARELDVLNPNRDPDASTFLSATREIFAPARISQEGYKWALPTKANVGRLALEASELPEADPKYLKDQPVVPERALLSMNDVANLSVGKLLNVTITKNGQSISVPIAIRLMVNELRSSTMAKMFKGGTLDKSFTERYYKWKSGRISFFNDLILCKDLIKEQKKALMEDKDGILSEIHTRANKNIKAGILSKRPSLATSSNIYVMSEATAGAVKRTSGFDLENFTQRQKLFEETYAMILVIIDRDYQRINFYHDGIRMPTSVGLRDIRSANKDSGPSIMDILNAYKQGQTPTL